jgi:hypothetical protein
LTGYKGKPKEVEVRGTLRTGVVAIGGETNGIVVQNARHGSYELELGGDRELRGQAEKLDGKAVVIRGTLKVRKGVEVQLRRIITVKTLKAAKK